MSATSASWETASALTLTQKAATSLSNVILEQTERSDQLSEAVHLDSTGIRMLWRVNLQNKCLVQKVPPDSKY